MTVSGAGGWPRGAGGGWPGMAGAGKRPGAAAGRGAGGRTPKRARGGGAPGAGGGSARGGSARRGAPPPSELLGRRTQEALERARRALAHAQAVGGELRALGALAAPEAVAAAAATLGAGAEAGGGAAPGSRPQPWLRPERGPEVPASSAYHADAAVLRRLAVEMEVVDRGGASHRERFERGLRAMQKEVQHDWVAWKGAHPRTMASAVGVGGAHRCL